MATRLVRMKDATYKQLRALAKEQRLTLSQALDTAVDQYRRKLFFDRVNRDYAAIWSDPKAAAEELAERKLYENTLMDGLRDDPYDWGDDERVAKHLKAIRAANTARGRSRSNRKAA